VVQRLLSLVALVVLAALPVHAAAKKRAHPKKRALPVLRVVPKAAAGKASATIGAQGGTLHVNTPNRTSVTLVVPAGAVASDTTITLTPLKSVKRVPFKRGIAGAVRLAPEGLVLAKPATLQIRPRKPIKTSLQTPFSSAGNGRSFHIYPGRRGRVLSLPIMHFSIYGEGKATKQERVSEAGRQQSSTQATIERDLAQGPSTAQLAGAFESLAKQVASEVTAALSDDAMVSKALDDGLSLAEELRQAGWSSEVLPNMGDQIPASVAGRLGPLIQQIRANFPAKILDNALARALPRCEADHSQKSRDDALSILELQRMFGLTGEIDLTVLDKCYGYELLYTHTSAGSASYSWDHSTSTFTDSGTYSESRSVKLSADVQLIPSADGTTYGGSGPLQFTDRTWSSTGNEHTNEGQQYPDFCDATVTDSLTSASDGTLVAASFTIGNDVKGTATLVGLSETWHHDWNNTSGPCGSVTGDGPETYTMNFVGTEHRDAGDKVAYVYDPNSGQATSVAVHLDTGWVPGNGAVPGTGSVVATRTLSGNDYDIGSAPKQDIPFTDSFQIIRTTT
jgi:hypothetical protein